MAQPFKEILQTILGKSFILLGGFGAAVLSSKIWGAEGRGAIALFVANLGFTAIFSNVFTNGCVCYYSTRVGVAPLMTQSLLWTVVVSLIAGAFFCHDVDILVMAMFFVISLLMAALTFCLSVLLGKQKVADFNRVTVFQPVALLCFMLFFWRFLIPSVSAYYVAMLVSYFLALVWCVSILKKCDVEAEFSKIRPDVLKKCFSYGVQEEIGAFLKLLVYRLPYYFLSASIGTFSVGVFSIGVALSESVCVISRSVSLVQYSHLLTPESATSGKAFSQTNRLAMLSLLLSVAVLLVAQIIPIEVYTFVFGSDFSQLKSILLLLSPGILSVSLTMVHSHYLMATGRLKPIILSSAVGAVVVALACFFFIPKYGLEGACYSNSIGHLVCSSVLFVSFYLVGRNLK